MKLNDYLIFYMIVKTGEIKKMEVKSNNSLTACEKLKALYKALGSNERIEIRSVYQKID